VCRKVAFTDTSAYGLLINFELQLWDRYVLPTAAKAPGSSTDGHTNLEANCHADLQTRCSQLHGYHSKKAYTVYGRPLSHTELYGDTCTCQTVSVQGYSGLQRSCNVSHQSAVRMRFWGGIGLPI
jgi:hypothetical protein